MNHTKANKPRSKSAWGKGIFVLYGGFVLFILGLVFSVAFERFDLVDKDYYRRELTYQQQIDKKTRTARLVSPLTWSYDPMTKEIKISFPVSYPPASVSGEIMFFRPSNARLDHSVPITVNEEHAQRIDVSDMVSGLWKMKIDWQAGRQAFYNEETVVIE